MATPTVVFAVAGEGKVSTSTLSEMLTDKIKSAGGKPLFYLPLCNDFGSDVVLSVAEVCSEKRWSFVAVTDDASEDLADTPEEISRWAESATKIVVTRNVARYLLDALAKSSASEKALLFAYEDFAYDDGAEASPADAILNGAMERGITALDLTTGLAVLKDEADDAEDEEEADDDFEEEEDDEDEVTPLAGSSPLPEDDFFEDEQEEEEEEAPPRRRAGRAAPASKAPKAPAKAAPETEEEPPEDEDPGAWRAYLDRLVQSRDKEMLYALGKPLGILPARGLRLPRLAEMILEAKLGKQVTPKDAEKARPARAKREAPEAKAAPAPKATETPAPRTSGGKHADSNREAARQLIQAALLLLGDEA